MSPRLGWPLWNTCVTNDHGYVPLVVNTSLSFPRSWLITGFVPRLIRRESLVEQKLLILSFQSTWVHPRFLVGFVLLDLQFYMYVLLIVVCPFVLFLLAIVLSVLIQIYRFWLPLWYLQSLLIIIWPVYFRVLLPLLVCVCIYLTCIFQGIATIVGMCVYIFDLYISGYCYHCWYVCVYIWLVYFRVLLPMLVCVCIYLTCIFQGIATNVGMCVYIFDLYISGYCYQCWYVCVYIWLVYFRVLLPMLVCVCIYLTCIFQGIATIVGMCVYIFYSYSNIGDC